MKNTALTLPPLSYDLPNPLTDCKAPVTRDKNTTENVDQLDTEPQEPISTLNDSKQHRFHIVLKKDSRDRAFAHLMVLRCHCILVGHDSLGARVGRGAKTVDSGDDGEEILELVKVGVCCGDGTIEGIEERWIERTE